MKFKKEIIFGLIVLSFAFFARLPDPSFFQVLLFLSFSVVSLNVIKFENSEDKKELLLLMDKFKAENEEVKAYMKTVEASAKESKETINQLKAAIAYKK